MTKLRWTYWSAVGVCGIISAWAFLGAPLPQSDVVSEEALQRWYQFAMILAILVGLFVALPVWALKTRDERLRFGEAEGQLFQRVVNRGLRWMVVSGVIAGMMTALLVATELAGAVEWQMAFGERTKLVLASARVLGPLFLAPATVGLLYAFLTTSFSAGLPSRAFRS